MVPITRIRSLWFKDSLYGFPIAGPLLPRFEKLRSLRNFRVDQSNKLEVWKITNPLCLEELSIHSEISSLEFLNTFKNLKVLRINSLIKETVSLSLTTEKLLTMEMCGDFDRVSIDALKSLRYISISHCHIRKILVEKIGELDLKELEFGVCTFETEVALSSLNFSSLEKVIFFNCKIPYSEVQKLTNFKEKIFSVPDIFCNVK